MRRIVAQFFISVDGVIESPEHWHLAYWNDEMRDAVAGELYGADTLLLGRNTYEVFAALWPSRGSDVLFADRINSMSKLVASTSLKTVDWQNSALISGSVADALAKVKQQPGKHLTVSGSPTLVRSLLRDNLLDELQLLVHPIVLGRGARLFQDGDPESLLGLVGLKTFATGVLHVFYQPMK
jgi:dihydrofolate reductase